MKIDEEKSMNLGFIALVVIVAAVVIVGVINSNGKLTPPSEESGNIGGEAFKSAVRTTSCGPICPAGYSIINSSCHVPKKQPNDCEGFVKCYDYQNSTTINYSRVVNGTCGWYYPKNLR